MTAHVFRKSRIVVEGKTATGESVTSVGKPGRTAKGKAGKTGHAKGGAGGSASATGGSATAGSVVIQTTTT